jgi:hypothetical protein
MNDHKLYAQIEIPIDEIIGAIKMSELNEYILQQLNFSSSDNLIALFTLNKFYIASVETFINIYNFNIYADSIKSIKLISELYAFEPEFNYKLCIPNSKDLVILFSRKRHNRLEFILSLETFRILYPLTTMIDNKYYFANKDFKFLVPMNLNSELSNKLLFNKKIVLEKLVDKL